MPCGPGSGASRRNTIVNMRPEPSEYGSSLGTYIKLVQRDDVMSTLAEMPLAKLRGVPDEVSLKRYAPGKWSLREVVGHVIDTERIFAYRALRFARNDATGLPVFEQDH